jgi:hypothetical protein
LDENEPDTFESNHTHFLMLDDGSAGEHMMEKPVDRDNDEHKMEIKNDRYYLNDQPRLRFVNELTKLSGCHLVTILIEGGLESLDVIVNDIKANHPVVIIHGSGRCATVIGNLLELTRDQITIEYYEHISLNRKIFSQILFF